MSKKKTVVFLEPKGTILEVIRAASQRGYHVIALSSDQSLLNVPAPYDTAIALINEVYPAKGWMNDSEISKMISEIEKFDVVGVYAGMDSCAYALTRFREHFKLRTTSPEAMLNTLNKFRLRRALVNAKLSKLKNFDALETITALKNMQWPFSGAAYFKPVHGSFSAFVKRCENLDNIRDAIAAWESKTGSPKYLSDYLSAGEFHIEESFEGELLSVEGISSGGVFKVLGLLSRILYSKNPVVEMGSCFPYPHPLAEKIVSLVARAHEVLGLTDGPTHTEVIVNPAGEVEIIDLNPRFVGADVLQSINHAFEIKVEEVLLDWALSNNIVVPKGHRKFSCLQYFLPPAVDTLESVRFPVDSTIRFTSTFISPGSNIESQERQIDYLGCYLTVGSSFDAALRKSNELRSGIVINEKYGAVY